ncbi:hypothetical protein : Uncharacterized protein OS=Singulisphaera acidiphila (strain ATCC BAA-1392 / DSM 18658 / VKM B-2454 / MOB10) GN=Sinac_5810 PE=4 SV=1: DUF1501 [Gemmata massiliana]|uniref:DUF1501 domain-containing protein n=1 Tax=Gemmata massiliana TaxID=1210884 RepID=A0A6P2D7I0_9BACT|nr:DUF1501 domain-containing protein [Gemmata massiliana]VTR95452.1 hypothetical protein : Uncharacterized protein OS=Singulisphaera acidiphila (strain ATCC BAA-1392 / DSM 18658 / VKM B-2454 / MOB10) GN=Sinac_5810 PE=4 SV=1: DUF1501 [Gemmata massiliana]
MVTPKPQSCGGLSRREMLRVGALAPLGFGLTDVLRARADAGAKKRARSVILLFMWGGPSHLDTWDPKPAAPLEVRGAFDSIATTVPGLRIGEHFPRLAARAHQYAVVRSMTHTDPAHLSPVHHLMTGRIAPKPNSDADGASRGDAPCLGAVVQKLAPATGAMPSAVTLPWAVSHPSAPGGTAPGQNGGWLGAGTDPFLVTGNPNQESFTVGGLSAPGDVPAPRLRSRAELSRLLDRTGEPGAGFTGLQGKALDLLLAPAVSTAFDLSREPARVRDKYGRHPHGQSCLLARRLVEAGTRLVTVNWPDDGHAFWDTHGDNFPSLKTRLMPPADAAFAALLDDLTARGLLDETLVVWVGEFGRTPRVENGGRQHWPQCYSAVLAGGGVRGGAVYGSSDRIGAQPASNPVSPADLTATVYHAMGIDPATEIPDPAGRPWKVADGTPVQQLFG